jgi:hypothetical protein
MLSPFSSLPLMPRHCRADSFHAFRHYAILMPPLSSLMLPRYFRCRQRR